MDFDRSTSSIDLFDRVVRLPHHQRIDFLNTHCPDPDTRREIESLLDSFDDAGDFLSERDNLEPHQVGTRIGPYELCELIGEGGFARVFRAHQERPVRRDVALKLLKLGMDTRAVIARFELERQTLAMMDHPHIAAVYDAGATPGGRPYFVMELVRGQRITQYCSENQLNIEQRISLLADVCQAVHHAHSKGVLHRDLKPSNVLVSTVDGRPLVKVIDFGIAKAVGHQSPDATMITSSQQLLGTPAYMSPEQALSGGTDVDTRSDVYSLGAMLYELLCGVPPLGPTERGSSQIEQIRRLTSDLEIPRVSTRADRETARRLRGELDWITGRCLEKNRARRYESAAALAADLHAFLEHRPIAAAPPTAFYRAAKFARRHTAAVVATALIVLTLIAGSIVSTVLAVRAVRAERLAQRRLSEVQTANSTLSAVNDFLTNDILGSADPAVQQGRKLTVEEALDNAARSIEGKFAGDALIEAAVRNSVAMSYLQLGDAETALPHAQRAAELRRGALGQEHVDTIRAVYDSIAVLKALDRFAEAEALARPTLQTAQRVLGEDHRVTMSLMDIYATSVVGLGRWSEAEPLAKAGWEHSARIFGPDDGRTLTAQNNYGRVLQLQGRFKDAEPIFRDVLVRRRRTQGDDHPQTLTTMNNLALMLKALACYDESEALYQESLTRRRRVLGNDHPHTLLTLGNYASFLDQVGRPGEAEPLMLEVMQRREAVLGKHHRESLMAMSNYANLLRSVDRAAEAEPISLEALVRSRSSNGLEHPDTLTIQNGYCVILQALGRDSEAEPLMRQTLEIRTRMLGEDHPHTRATLSNYATSLRAVGRAGEAESYARRALESAQRANGPDHPDTIKMMGNYAVALNAAGRGAEAESFYKGAYEANRRVLGASHPESLTSQSNYATWLSRQGRDSEAAPLWSDLNEQAKSEKSPPKVSAGWRASYGACLTRLGRYTDAEPVLLSVCDRIDLASADGQKALTALVDLYTRTDRPNAAARWSGKLVSLPVPTTQPDNR